MYKRILVPIDGSASANAGLAEAIQLAALTGGQIRLLHMVDELSIVIGMDAYGAMTGEVMDQLRKAGEAVLQEARAEVLHHGLAVDTVLSESYRSSLADLVVEQCQSWPAELVVMGSHGRRGAARVLLGSDAEQVARIAPVPVLLVRQPKAAQA